ncbi:MAG: dephospho-CoA kinase [Clostridia bacterium]|nr:dephospho-CoA kinase [Clostridia bacterium]
MMQSKKFAITGGIASGKSVVLEIFRRKGFATFSCDEISRELWEDEGYRAGLCELFPECAPRGEIDKRALSALVFSDEKALMRLNAYAHPRILQELTRRMEGENIAFAEVPLLFECALEDKFDGVIAVRRGYHVRIQAARTRDGLTEEEVRLRMARQFNPAAYEKMPCDILENNGSLEDLENKVEAWLKLHGVSH